jgi:hypothetical protein
MRFAKIKSGNLEEEKEVSLDKTKGDAKKVFEKYTRKAFDKLLSLR